MNARISASAIVSARASVSARGRGARPWPCAVIVVVRVCHLPQSYAAPQSHALAYRASHDRSPPALPRRDPEGLAQQVRVGRAAAGDQARPLPVLLRRLSDRLRVHPATRWARTATRSTRWSAVSEPTFPGCVIPVKPIALFKMRDDKGVDDKVLCVPLEDPNWNTIETLDDLPQQLRDEISHFFSIYKTPEGKVVKVDGWFSREDALARDRRVARALARAAADARRPRARAGMSPGAGDAARRAAGAVPGPRPTRLPERRHERPAAARGGRRGARAARARAGGGRARRAALRAPRASSPSALRAGYAARARLRAGRPRADDLARPTGSRACCSALDLRPGDEIVTSDEEHPGLLGPLAAQRARGVAVRVVPLGERRRRGRPAHAARRLLARRAGAAGALAPGRARASSTSRCCSTARRASARCRSTSPRSARRLRGGRAEVAVRAGGHRAALRLAGAARADAPARAAAT